jgi:hypothetical protein
MPIVRRTRMGPHTIHFADPYGDLCNVVKLVIKVEVIPADIAAK